MARSTVVRVRARQPSTLAAGRGRLCRCRPAAAGRLRARRRRRRDPADRGTASRCSARGPAPSSTASPRCCAGSQSGPARPCATRPPATPGCRPCSPPGWRTGSRRTSPCCRSLVCCGSWRPPAGWCRPSARVVAAVRRNYSPGVAAARFGRRASVYGVWFKAAEKSLIWYDVAAFERAGVVPPTDLPGLLRRRAHPRRVRGPGVRRLGGRGLDAHRLVRGPVPASGRPAQLRPAGAHRLAWTDPSVVATLREMARLLAPGNIAGGVAGARRTDFEESVGLAFGPRRARRDGRTRGTSWPG